MVLKSPLLVMCLAVNHIKESRDIVLESYKCQAKSVACAEIPSVLSQQQYCYTWYVIISHVILYYIPPSQRDRKSVV